MILVDGFEQFGRNLVVERHAELHPLAERHEYLYHVHDGRLFVEAFDGR